MSENECVVAASAQDVFAVLTDGWRYAAWVVGASRVRDVDAPWPEPGGIIHHSVGAWPLLIDDTTEAVEYDAGHRLRLRVRAWPVGEGDVEFRVTESPDGCRVLMTEKAVRGPATLLPEKLADMLLSARNAETLHRLKLLAEQRTGP